MAAYLIQRTVAPDMKIWALAFRNLLRNRRRSVTTLMAMIMGLIATLIFGGYRSDLMYLGQSVYVQLSGHLQIQRRGYFLDGQDNPTSYGIAKYSHLIEVIKQDPVLSPMLRVVTPTLQLGGVAGNFMAGVSRAVGATGVVVREHNLMLSWNDYGTTTYFHPLPLTDTEEDGVVVGRGLARKLDLCAPLALPDCKSTIVSSPKDGQQIPKDIAALSNLEKRDSLGAGDARIELLAANPDGAPNVVSLNVLEAENMGLKAWDDAFLYMHLAQAQQLVYGRRGIPQVTAIQIQLQHTEQMGQARLRLAHLLETQFKNDPLDILDFGELNPAYAQTNQFMDSLFGFIAVLIGVIVLFTISNTMSTAVIERTVEIGTLRAFGLRRSGVRRLFVCEGILLGLLAGVVGAIFSVLMAFLINHSGLSWTPPNYVYAYLIEVRVWQDKALLVGCLVGLVVVSIGSAWWPASRAANLIIVDALRHV
jgi:putative ABC transport system permease protein